MNENKCKACFYPKLGSSMTCSNDDCNFVDAVPLTKEDEDIQRKDIKVARKKIFDLIISSLNNNVYNDRNEYNHLFSYIVRLDNSNQSLGIDLQNEYRTAADILSNKIKCLDLQAAKRREAIRQQKIKEELEIKRIQKEKELEKERLRKQKEAEEALLKQKEAEEALRLQKGKETKREYSIFEDIEFSIDWNKILFSSNNELEQEPEKVNNQKSKTFTNRKLKPDKSFIIPDNNTNYRYLTYGIFDYVNMTSAVGYGVMLLFLMLALNYFFPEVIRFSTPSSKFIYFIMVVEIFNWCLHFYYNLYYENNDTDKNWFELILQFKTINIIRNIITLTPIMFEVYFIYQGILLGKDITDIFNIKIIFSDILQTIIIFLFIARWIYNYMISKKPQV